MHKPCNCGKSHEMEQIFFSNNRPNYLDGWACPNQRRARMFWVYNHMDPKSKKAKAIARLARIQDWANVRPR